MKIVENKIVINGQIDYDNIEDYFKKLFIKIKETFDIEIDGFYVVNIYHDKIYGDILELIKKDNYYYDQVDIKINIIDTTFLYKIDKYDLDLEKYDIYKYNNEIYVKIKKELKQKDYLKLLENSDILYDTEKIFLNAEKI